MVESRAADGRPVARRARWVLVPLAVVTGIVFLELVLQVGALVVWLRSRNPQQVPKGRDVVLCVGDSWTHGMGSSDPSQSSYPAALERSIRQRTGRDWLVVNGGQSGQNSRDVLQRLPAQLAEFEPRVVCVLVGQNDFWTVPELLPADERTGAVDHTAYRFRWRIPRLVAWIAGRLAGGEAAGTVRAPRTGPEWEPRRTTADHPYRKEPRKWSTPPATLAAMREGWQLLDAKDFAGAAARFEPALAQAPDDAEVHQALARLYFNTGKLDAMRVQLDWLRASYEKDGDLWTGRCLVSALSSCGLDQEVIQVATELLARYPNDASIWRLRGQAEFFVRRFDDARRSLDQSIALSPDPLAYFDRFKLFSVGLRDHDEAIRTVYAGYVACNDARRAVDCLLILTNGHHEDRFRPVLEQFECAPDVRARLGQLIDEVLASVAGDGVRRVLAEHLRRIVTAVRNAGATPLLLTYPVELPASEVLQQVAAETETPFVAVAAPFHELLGKRTWNDVRSPDGHCNDEGYRLMATVVDAALAPFVR